MAVKSQIRYLRHAGKHFCLGLLLALSTSQVHAQDEFPRVGVKWHDFKAIMLQRGIGVEEVLTVSDALLMSPNPGGMVEDYRNRIAEVRKLNPDLLVFRYMNVTEVIPNTGVWAPVFPVMTDYFNNPNRGGANNAGDGWLRTARGSIANYWTDNGSINISNYVQPYDGRLGVAGADEDISIP